MSFVITIVAIVGIIYVVQIARKKRAQQVLERKDGVALPKDKDKPKP